MIIVTLLLKLLNLFRLSAPKGSVFVSGTGNDTLVLKQREAVVGLRGVYLQAFITPDDCSTSEALPGHTHVPTSE